MRLNEVLQLQEALRFGNQEIRTVMQHANEFLVGIEYEFHPEGIGPDQDAIDELYNDMVNAEVDEAVDDIMSTITGPIENINEIVNEVASFMRDSDNIRGLNFLERVYKGNVDFDPENYSYIQSGIFFREIANLAYRITFSMEREDYEDAFPYIDTDEGAIERLAASANNVSSIVIDTSELKLTYVGDEQRDAFLSWYETNEDELGELAEFADDMNDFWVEVESISISDTEETVADTVRENIDDYVDTNDIRERAYDLAMDMGDSIDGYVDDRAYEALEEYGIDSSDIQLVTTEHQEQVEIITEPLRLPHALDVLENMCDLIAAEGTTSSNSGMHVNMSIPGINMKDFNPIKFGVLIDDDFLRSGSVDKIVSPRYSPRGHSDKLFNWSAPTLADFVLHYVEFGFNGLVEKIESATGTEGKSTSINMNSVFDAKVSERRIEFRYFGGPNYETKAEQLKADIIQAAYIMAVALADGFEEEKYAKDLLRIVNRHIEKMTNGKFGFWDGVSMVKSGKFPDLDELRNFGAKTMVDIWKRDSEAF